MSAICSFALITVLEAKPLNLSQAYEMALKNEPHLKSALYKANATAEMTEQSLAQLYPRIQASGSWGRYEYEYQRNTNPVKESYSSYSLSATQPIFHPELWRGVDEAKAKVKSAQYQYQAQSQQMALDLAKSYFTVLHTQKNIELIGSQKAYYETKYRQLQELLKFGLTNRIDLLEAKVQRDKSAQELLTEEKRFQVSKLRLEYLIGEPVDSLTNLDSLETEQLLLSIDRSEWEKKVSANPTLLSAQSAKEAALHQVAIREYQHYPKVDLSLSRKETYTKDEISHKYDNQAIVQVNLPLYEGGYTQSRIAEGKLLLESADQELQYYEKNSNLRFEELWAEYESGIKSITLLKEAEESAQLYVESMEKGYASGLKSLVDVLEAKAKLYEVKRDRVNSIYEMINNQLGLLDITGELDAEKIAVFERKIGIGQH